VTGNWDTEVNFLPNSAIGTEMSACNKVPSATVLRTYRLRAAVRFDSWRTPKVGTAHGKLVC
jgi:hypothetical protein